MILILFRNLVIQYYYFQQIKQVYLPESSFFCIFLPSPHTSKYIEIVLVRFDKRSFIDKQRIHQEISKIVRSFPLKTTLRSRATVYREKGWSLMGKTSKDDAEEEIRVVRTCPTFLRERGNNVYYCVYFVYSVEKKQRAIRPTKKDQGKPFLLNLITEFINF